MGLRLVAYGDFGCGPVLVKVGPLMLQPGSGGTVRFQCEATQKYVRIVAGKNVDVKGFGGGWCEFWLRPVTRGLVRIESASSEGLLCVDGDTLSTTSWRIVNNANERDLFRLVPDSPKAAPYVPRGWLLKDLLSFRDQGFVVARGCVDASLVENALREINRRLPAREDLAETQKHRAISDTFFSSEAWQLASDLMGGGLEQRRRQGQIALRPPKDERARALKGTEWHADGCGVNDPSPFSLLVGVALSDQSKPGSGNLVVYPGSHLHVIRDYKKRADTGIPLPSAGQEDDTAKPHFFNAEELLLRPGDVVFAHQKLAHRAGTNTSSCHIRYQLYFRIHHQQHQAFIKDGSLLTDPFREFPSLPTT